MLENLNGYKIFLASKSPRRRELLQMLRIPFKVVTINGIDESFPDDISPLQVPEFISRKKAKVYLERMQPKELVITADTMVICGDRIMGKPKNPEDAVEMLLCLSGKTHQVATGVTISTADRTVSFSSVTDVTFAPLSEEEIRFYVDNYQPFDKAGAYGIQEWIGAVAVSGINGSYYNVMGLPVHRLFQELKQF
ncbi:Maf-like protein [Lepagella muris]|jgi:septum formation protein|uniref:Septum formation protein Maf n=1 Tax=Lepagella muris TaxID=3032870 RepID=A0AC61RJL9_9BACT|nr:Maf-like protein [Lepagella muris]ROT06090.1 septum formation protein Maf [Muribaculaceae bacterium Isolate-037 (Harlan)]TGY80477.1 septum formation protein Maf [Lepagella muris]THG53375.1 septum formation protein Maf [Bacteroidales bacterium]TKC61630.1 septum formation protein Maf [Bacteroidales bacterium]